MLNNQQEKELLRYLRRLYERLLPPLQRIVRNIAQELCGHTLSKNWVARFIERHHDTLGAGFLNTIDLKRCHAESPRAYERYFERMGIKMDEDSVIAENIYNMDEKGFLLGCVKKTRKVFTKELLKSKKLLGSGQDGSRE